MNWLVKWGVKRWALNFINELLAKYKDNVQDALVIVDKAIAKAEAVLIYLKSVRAKLADNKIEDEEAEAIIKDAEALIKEILK